MGSITASLAPGTSLDCTSRTWLVIDA